MPERSTEFNWPDLTDRMGYADTVRAAFGSGAASNVEVIERLLPPMRSLESIQIEVTTWCNFACQQCARTKGLAAGDWQNQHIPFPRVQAIIEKLPPTRILLLQGIGEPSMHPQFVEMIRFAAESGKFEAIHFNTNAHTHDDEFWKALAAFPLAVGLSVDSLDPIVAERCRSGTDVNILWRRLQLFRDTFPSYIVAMVASRLNLDDIERTLRRIAEFGGVRVQITRMMSDDVTVVLQLEDELRLSRILAAVRDDHPDFTVYFNANNSGFPAGQKRCVSPFLNPYVRADGYLAPCCAAVGAEHYGHVRADDVRDWDALRSDPRVLGWVRDFVDDDPEVCRGCSLNPNQRSLVKKG